MDDGPGPNPTYHRYISFCKSGLRITAGIALCSMHFYTAGLLFVLAEVLGIVEEIV